MNKSLECNIKSEERRKERERERERETEREREREGNKEYREEQRAENGKQRAGIEQRIGSTRQRAEANIGRANNPEREQARQKNVIRKRIIRKRRRKRKRKRKRKQEREKERERERERQRERQRRAEKGRAEASERLRQRQWQRQTQYEGTLAALKAPWQLSWPLGRKFWVGDKKKNQGKIELLLAKNEQSSWDVSTNLLMWEGFLHWVDFKTSGLISMLAGLFGACSTDEGALAALRAFLWQLNRMQEVYIYFFVGRGENFDEIRLPPAMNKQSLWDT